jgi:hypothetical protein
MIEFDSHVLMDGVSIQASVGGCAELSRIFQLSSGDPAQDTCRSAASSNEGAPHDDTHDGFSGAPSGKEDHKFFAAVHYDGT